MNYLDFYYKFKENPEEAKIYKANHVPKKLYKYMSLHNSYKEKVSNLLNNKLWLSTCEGLNDPFEYHNLFLDVDYLKEYGWSDEDIHNCILDYDNFRNSVLIGSFTNTFNSNMPLWAHYANNHKGICIEYEVIDCLKIYPVSYESQRIEATHLIVNYLTKSSEDKIKEVGDDFLVLLLQSCMKHQSWRYEEEYRIITYNIRKQKYGDNFNLDNLGLKLNAIHLGYNIEESHKQEMINIGQKLGIDIFEMDVNKHCSEFNLKSVKIFDSNEKVT